MYSKSKEKVCNPQDIANLFAEYYQDLNNLKDLETSHPVSEVKIDYFLTKLSLPSLTPQHLEQLNKPVSLHEVWKAFNTSKLLKSPGPDGLPNEYYCTFVDSLSPHFQTVCQSFFSGRTPPAEIL